MSRLTIAVAAMMFLGSAAQAQTASQKDLLNDFADAMAVAQYCPTWKVNTRAVERELTSYGMSAADIQAGRRFHDTFRSLFQTAKYGHELNGEKMTCSYAKLTFGPDGLKRKSFMVKSKG